jgi:alpha-N-acetylglucosamine transferase
MYNGRCRFTQRVILLDSDMVMFKNMDELFDLPLAKGQIAATYVCACNPRKKSHVPADWYVHHSQNPS